MQVATAEERPDLVTEMDELGGSPWPEFMLHDPVVGELFDEIYRLAPAFQFALLDDAGAVAALGNCIPVRWDGDPGTLPHRGLDAMLEEGVECARTGASGTAVSALQIVVREDHLGRGLSSVCVETMASLVARHGFSDLVAPVRPTHKHRYPLMPMDEYMAWRRDDGLPFDPWLRVHERVGGELLHPCPEAMRIEGSVAEWEGWTGLAMPETGPYVIEGGLVPVEIDRERDLGSYVEPGCWVRHGVAAQGAA
jgi:GNAT superfamily N-acetyltransferase